MKKTSLVLTTSALVWGLGTLSGQTLLIDLGNSSTFRGASVTSPDTNGNSWNSVSGGGFAANLIDTTGSASTVDWAPDGVGNTDSFNGPGYADQYVDWGTLSTPQQDAAVADMVVSAGAAVSGGSLGDFAVGAAVMDYYVSTSGRFQLQQVTPGQLYDLSFFGSKRFPTNDTSTTISVYDDNAYSNLLGSVTVAHGSGGSENLASFGTISGLLGPENSNNIFYIEFMGDQGGTGYLNAMSLTAVPEPTTMALFGGLGALLFVAFRRRRR
jgi:hypothetical protein